MAITTLGANAIGTLSGTNLQMVLCIANTTSK